MNSSTFLSTRFAALSLAGALILGAAGTSHAQSFTNGNFESGTVGTVGTSSTAVTGWTTTVGGGTSANVYHGNNSSGGWIPNAQSGSYCIQLDGSSPVNDQAFLSGAQTTISQTFKIGSLGNYSVSFYMSGEVGSGKNGTVGALVSLTGSGITGAVTGKEYTISNGTATTGSWTQETLNFSVTDPTQAITLSFADDNTHTGTSGAYTSTLANYTASSNLAIDNVAIVPEPSTLVGSGLLLLAGGVALFRRRRQAA